MAVIGALTIEGSRVGCYDELLQSRHDQAVAADCLRIKEDCARVGSSALAHEPGALAA